MNQELEADAWEVLNGEIVSCRACPRLVAWREEVARTKRRAYQDLPYWGRPVPGFGDRQARLLVLGLAPAAHGANRTGRMFSGDSAGRTLIPALYRAGFANQPESEGPGDGLVLRDLFLTAVCRCAPPGNRPTPQEICNCWRFWTRELELLPRLRVVVALGHVAFEAYVRWYREQGALSGRPAFGHGVLVRPEGDLPVLIGSYHPSRQNTNTGRLTPPMLDEVFRRARSLLEE
ncbi:MAG: uracil-DNA glycosylase [Chloroflexia bacterium]